MKAFVIGDIHGCFQELQELIQDIDRSTTRIICVGDLIDRGPQSEAVIDFIRSNNIECVKGNHEYMAIECLSDLIIYNDDPTNPKVLYNLYESDWFYNGGHDVLNQYKQNSSVQKLIDDIRWLGTLPLLIRTGIIDEYGLELVVSHTYCGDRNLERATKLPSDFVWNRTQPHSKRNISNYYNIYGHTPVDYVNQKKYNRNYVGPIEPEWFDGACNIDTGCCYDTPTRGYLTGVFFPSLEVKQVKRK